MDWLWVLELRNWSWLTCLWILKCLIYKKLVFSVFAILSQFWTWVTFQIFPYDNRLLPLVLGYRVELYAWNVLFFWVLGLGVTKRCKGFDLIFNFALFSWFKLYLLKAAFTLGMTKWARVFKEIVFVSNRAHWVICPQYIAGKLIVSHLNLARRVTLLYQEFTLATLIIEEGQSLLWVENLIHIVRISWWKSRVAQPAHHLLWTFSFWLSSVRIFELSCNSGYQFRLFVFVNLEGTTQDCFNPPDKCRATATCITFCALTADTFFVCNLIKVDSINT